MNLKKITLICLVAIAVGALAGLWDVKLNGSNSSFVSRQINDARIKERVSASRISLSESEALEREKADGLGEFLATQIEVVKE